MRVRIVLMKSLKFRRPIVLEGFPGIGLIGTISASYLVDKLGLEQIGYLKSERFPPMAAIHNAKPMHPARIYGNESFVVFLSEFVIPYDLVYPLGLKIVNFSQRNNAKFIFSLAGMISTPYPSKKRKLFGVGSNEETRALLREHGVELIKEGTTTGVSGVILSECSVRGLNAMSILVETQARYPDPRGAALVLEKFASITGIKVDTTQLIEEAERIEEEIRQVMARVRRAQEKYRSIERSPMYG